MANKFVWRVHLRQDVLDDAMLELRALPYEELRRIADEPLRKQVRGRDQKIYDLTVTAEWEPPGSTDLEITVLPNHPRFSRTVNGPVPDTSASDEETT